jgi:hypothetical protein
MTKKRIVLLVSLVGLMFLPGCSGGGGEKQEYIVTYERDNSEAPDGDRVIRYDELNPDSELATFMRSRANGTLEYDENQRDKVIRQIRLFAQINGAWYLSYEGNVYVVSIVQNANR